MSMVWTLYFVVRLLQLLVVTFISLHIYHIIGSGLLLQSLEDFIPTSPTRRVLTMSTALFSIVHDLSNIEILSLVVIGVHSSPKVCSYLSSSIQLTLGS